jgi:hypothetical protein
MSQNWRSAKQLSFLSPLAGAPILACRPFIDGWGRPYLLLGQPHLLPDLIILVVGLSKCKGSATEIAQFALGDLAFNVQYPHYKIYL